MDGPRALAAGVDGHLAHGSAGRLSADARAFVWFWSALGLGLVLLAAVWSDGFYHPDEHFQTLEFAGHKLGRTPAEALPWEFSSRLRAWLQPGLYVVLIRAGETLGITDPFHQALGLRVFSGLLFWLALVAVTRNAWLWVPGEEARRWSVRLTWLACFMPYLAVRTSSESLATSCFLLGLATLAGAVDGGRRGSVGLSFVAGAWFGLSVQFRFAVGVMVAGALLWTVASRRVGPRPVVALVAGIVPPQVLGALVDRWGYGEWTLPLLHYVQRNLEEGIAAERFGTLPWYGYLSLTGNSGLAPLLLPLVLGTAVAWLRWPRHPLTAVTVPFVLAHSLLAHKELRFLFPIAPVAPMLLVLAGLGRDGQWLRPLRAPAATAALRVLLALDVVALAALTLAPTRPGIGFQRYVYRHYPERFEAYLLRQKSPFDQVGLAMHFYRPASLDLHHVRRLDAVPARGAFLVIDGAFAAPDGAGLRCDPLYRPFPPWFSWTEALGPGWRLKAWSLHRCRPDAAPPARHPGGANSVEAPARPPNGGRGP